MPSIGGLSRPHRGSSPDARRRYDDTALILDAVLEHGMTSAEGRTAIRRMNQMHRSYAISNDDLLRAGHLRGDADPLARRLRVAAMTEIERIAGANYYRELGRLMG